MRSLAGYKLLVLWSIVSWPALGVSQSEIGQITINTASFKLLEFVGQLDVDAEITLPPEVADGLNSGVPLEFIVELRLLRPRGWLLRWLPAANVATFQRRYSLIYYELTRHYRVRSLDTDVSRNFRSLLPALEELGALQNIMIPIAEKQVSSIKDAQLASLLIKLNSQALPLPLQPVFSSTWRLSSKDHQWPIN